MDAYGMRPRTILGLVLLLFASFCRSVIPADAPVVLCDAVAQVALDSGKEDEARAGFAAALRRATGDGNVAEQAQCSFYLGLTAHLAAAKIAAKRSDYLREAAEWYRTSIRIGGVSSGVVQNLARVEADLGHLDELEALFQGTIGKVEGAQQEGLKRSFADLFAATDRWPLAVQLYRQLLDETPADSSTWQALLALLSRRDPAALADAVWGAVKARQTVTAQAAAFSAVSDKNLPADVRISLLAAIVSGLSRQFDDLSTLLSSEQAGRLAALKDDPIVGVGAVQVLALGRRTDLDPQDFSWWEAGSPDSEKSRLAAFRSLLRSLAMASRGDVLRPSRDYLKLAEELNPATPDLDLYMDRMANYAARGEGDLIKQSVTAWEPLLRQNSERLSGLDLARFHLLAARLLPPYPVRPDAPGSAAYQLDRATEYAKRSGDSVMEAAVSEYRHQVFSGQGGRGWGTPNAADLECRGAPDSPCFEGRVAVPDLKDEGRTVPATYSGAATVMVKIACDGPRVLGRSTLRRAGPSVAAAALDFGFAGAVVASLGSGRSPILRIASRSQRSRLRQQPRWVTSGAWVSRSELLVVDTLTRELLRYGIDGTLREVMPAPETEGELPVQVRAWGESGFVTQTADGGLLFFDRHGEFSRRMQLRGRHGNAGILRAIYDWAPASSGALVLAMIERPRGGWVAGVVYVPDEERKPFELRQTLPAADPSLLLYRLGNPYLASQGDCQYFIDLRGPMSLDRFCGDAVPRQLAPLAGDIPLDARRLLDLRPFQATVEVLYRKLEALTMPAGLYTADGWLFLLVRNSAGPKAAPWQIWRIDPATGRVAAKIDLPTMAPYLTAIPGPITWAFLEKDHAEQLGVQNVRSLLLVPAADLLSSQQLQIRDSVAVSDFRGALYPASPPACSVPMAPGQPASLSQCR